MVNRAKFTKKIDLIFLRRHFFSHFNSEIITDIVFGAEKTLSYSILHTTSSNCQKSIYIFILFISTLTFFVAIFFFTL
jgi:hypothetical protein